MPYYHDAVDIPEVGLYEWRPHSRHPLVIGNGRGGRVARLMLHEMRWREPPRQRVLRILAGFLTIVLHLLALVFMSLAPLSGPPSAAGGQTQVAAIDVRLINGHKPPPPPPIKLPELKTKHVVRHAPPAIKRAPVAAMPPIPTPALAIPKVTLSPVQPQVALTPSVPVPVPLHATASPPALKPSPVAMPPPPSVVEEISRNAVPTVSSPKLETARLTPVQEPSSGLQPIPAVHQAPLVTTGKGKLNLHVSAPVQIHPLATTKVMASLPSMPPVNQMPSVEQVTPTPTLAPPVTTPVQTPQAVKAPSVPLAPIPQAPATAIVPRLNLPIAHVQVPQAPQVQVPAVHVEMPQKTVASPARPARSTSAATPPAAVARTSTSWAPADDQFKPITGHSSQPKALANRPSSRKGTVQLLPQGNSNVMTRDSDRLGYKPTIFSQYWAPLNESILDTFLRRFIEKFTVAHTFELAPGVRVKCVLGPMSVFFACGSGSPPRPESPESNDSRLDMAPARPLVPGLGVPAPALPSTVPAVQFNNHTQCTVAKVAGSPPPPGCPSAPPSSTKSDTRH